jgi:cardiolipin synthase
VQNAYLGDDRIVHELIRARQRGVDVRVIVPERPDSALMNASNAVTLNALNDAGVRVYLYPGMSHVKAAIYDGWVCLGTANFDRLSLRVNKEVNVASSDPALVEAVRARVFEQDFAVSDELLGRRDVGAMEHVYERVVDLLL